MTIQENDGGSLPEKRRFQIRAATSADSLAMQELYERVVGTAEWMPAEAKTSLDFAAASQDEAVFVCLDRSGPLAGIMSIYEPESFVHHLYVAPEFQHQGVGTALLTSLETWLPRPWRLKCGQANVAARAFYEARGWAEIGVGASPHGDYWLLENRPNANAVQEP